MFENVAPGRSVSNHGRWQEAFLGHTRPEKLWLIDSWIRVFRSSVVATLSDFKRYYFGTLKISKCTIGLSVLTASDLSSDLKVVKRSLHIPLIRFEDANVELGWYLRWLINKFLWKVLNSWIFILFFFIWRLWFAVQISPFPTFNFFPCHF